MFYTRMWSVPENKGITRTTTFEAGKLKLVSEGCNPKFVSILISSLFLNLLSPRIFFHLLIAFGMPCLSIENHFLMFLIKKFLFLFSLSNWVLFSCIRRK